MHDRGAAESWIRAHVQPAAVRIGRFAHVIAWERQRDFLPSGSRLQPDRATFDAWFAQVLRRAISVI